MGFFTALARITLDMTVVTLVIMFMPGFPPYTTFEESIIYPLPPPWKGPLESNEKLNLVDKLFENKIKGPESFAVWDGALYTGLISGRIVRIDPDDLTIETVARIGEECQEQYEEDKCGRPLALEFTQDGQLLVCDAVFGLYMIDLNRQVDTTGRIVTDTRDLDRVGYTSLLSPDRIVDGLPNILINSLALSSDNDTVYLTVTSTRFSLKESLFELVSDPSGRLLKFSISTKEVEVLASGISWANGIELQQGEEEWVIFCETGRARLMKHYLKGDKKGQTEVYLDNMPGLPDNIRINDNGNYYVGLVSPRIPGKPHILPMISPHNLARKFLARLMAMVMIPFKILNSVMPIAVSLRFEYWCANCEPIAHLAPPYGLVIEVDHDSGEILSSLHSTNGEARFISEAFVYDRWIYFGSPYTNYLARIPKRLRYTSPQKSSAGVTLGMQNDPEPQEATVLTEKM